MAQNPNAKAPPADEGQPKEVSGAAQAREVGLQQVAEWLQSLGFANYIELFRKHRIGWNALPKLTEAHLEKMGIPTGDSIELLEEIEKISRSAEQPASSLKDQPLPADFHSTSPRIEEDEEREKKKKEDEQKSKP
jgi:hypothetical protein